jgi:acetyl-CoA synthetase
MQDGVAMLAGIDDAVAAVQAAVDVGSAWKRPPSAPLLVAPFTVDQSALTALDEAASKAMLADAGVPVPESRVVGGVEEAVAAAEALGFPVVIKALGVAHKTDVGGVRLNLRSADDVASAMKMMAGLSKMFLVERMVEDAVAEIIVGVAQDEQFGPYLVVGGGGILVELMKDSASLLLPVTREQVLDALDGLQCAPLLNCFRGCPQADLNAAADVVLAIAALVEKDPEAIVELDVNPLMVLAEGQGAVAADALIRLNGDR